MNRKRQVDQILQPTEECRLAAELTHANARNPTTNVKSPKLIILSLIFNKTAGSYGIFLMEDIDTGSPPQSLGSPSPSTTTTAAAVAAAALQTSPSSSPTIDGVASSAASLLLVVTTPPPSSNGSPPPSNNSSSSSSSSVPALLPPLSLIAALPINTEFGIKIAGETQFDIYWRTKTANMVTNLYLLNAPTIGTMWTVISALTKAYQIACKMTASPQQHDWVQSYHTRFGLDATDTPVEYINPLYDGPDNTDSLLSAIPDNIAPPLLPQAASAKTASKSLPAVPSQPQPAISQQQQQQQQQQSHAPSAVTAHTYFSRQQQSSRKIDVKEDYIQRRLRAREVEFTERRTLQIVTVTWNVNSKTTDESLMELLLLDRVEADIYCIGLQEIDMTAGALIKEETEQGEVWNATIESELARTKLDYVHVASQQLVGVFACLYMKRSLLPYLGDVRVAIERVGIMGMMGNKGGVGIRFRLFDSTLCFIIAHFVPHDKATERRNQNMHDIIDRMVFVPQPGNLPAPMTSTVVQIGIDEEFRPNDHEILFWLGDLNYRISLSDADCRRKIKEEKWDELTKYDQLLTEKQAGRVFVGFNEGPLNFAPTYKFDPGTDEYDTSEKKRVPSYTDRILWRTLSEKDARCVRQKWYGRHGMMISDHKPVSAYFEYDAKIIIESKYRQCHMEEIKRLDRRANQMLPVAKFDKQQFVFADVRYNQPVEQVMTVENAGEVPLQFMFKSISSNTKVSKDWLHIYPQAGFIMPTEKMEVHFTVWVDNRTADIVTAENCKLEDVLIIHLENGRDHFLSIDGNFIKENDPGVMQEGQLLDLS